MGAFKKRVKYLHQSKIQIACPFSQSMYSTENNLPTKVRLWQPRIDKNSIDISKE